MNVDLYRLIDLDLDDDARQVFKKLLDSEIFEFLEKNLTLDDNTIVIDSDYASKMKITRSKYSSVLNFQKVNNLNDVNEYIRVVSLILQKGGKYFCCFDFEKNPSSGNSNGVLVNILQRVKKKNGNCLTKEDIYKFFITFDLYLIAEKKINNLTYMIFTKE